MGNLDDALKKFAKKHGIERQLEASDVVEKATTEIAKFIDPNDFEVISFKDNVLKIQTRSSSAASEINIQKEKVLKKIKTIKRIKVVI